MVFEQILMSVFCAVSKINNKTFMELRRTLHYSHIKRSSVKLQFVLEQENFQGIMSL